MRKIKFAPGEYYHIFNHGVENRKVFKTNSDFMRALVSLVVFNNTKSSPSQLFRFVENPAKLIREYTPDNRKKLIDLIAFTFIPNHYHFLAKERLKNGISYFMHSFNKGYSRYFNIKNDRSGALWKAKFGAKRIDNDAYSMHIISYIHLNILDLYQPEWRKGNIKNWSKATKKLISYPWSSYAFYRTQKSNILFMDKILSPAEWLKEYYPNPKSFEEDIRLWSTRSHLVTQ